MTDVAHSGDGENACCRGEFVSRLLQSHAIRGSNQTCVDADRRPGQPCPLSSCRGQGRSSPRLFRGPDLRDSWPDEGGANARGPTAWMSDTVRQPPAESSEVMSEVIAGVAVPETPGSRRSDLSRAGDDDTAMNGVSGFTAGRR